MAHSFSAALAAYRDLAAKRFLHQRASTTKTASSASSSTEHAVYKRTLFPALSSYLRIAACNYQAFKKHHGTSFFVHPIRRTPPKALGTSSIVPDGLAAEVRRAQFLNSLSIARHRNAALHLRSSLPVPPLPSAIPKDVLQRLHSRFLQIAESRTSRTVYPTFTPPSVMTTLDVPARSLGTSDTTATKPFPPPCAHHANRCREIFSETSHTLHPQNPAISIPSDSAAQVLSRYKGKPDELYIRKNSKRFAAYRRRTSAAHSAMSQRKARAESVMCRSRGHDQLLSHRAYGETSFAPFLFDLDSRAYAFSSKISQAPKLRKAMIDKYADSSQLDDVDPLQKAHLAAHTNPLFHTRVMNRFS